MNGILSDVIYTFLTTLAAVINIYTMICLLRILMTWIPAAINTRFGQILCKITDPYLGLFSRMRFLHADNLDFSPIVSIGLLSLLSSILSAIIQTGRLYLGGILSSVILELWSIVSSLLFILFLFILIRWIVLLANKNKIDTSWYSADDFLRRITRKISGIFIKHDSTFKKDLLVSWITILVIMLAGSFLFRVLAALCLRIPF